jgi:hypothetical protein
MKKLVALLVSVVLITFGIFNSPVVANSTETTSDESNTEIVSDQTTEPEPELEQKPNTTPIVDNSMPKEVTDNPDLGNGYAVIDSNGVISNVIVCSYNVCGANNDWLDVAIKNGAIQPGSRLVLQTTRNKETGNVAGYTNAQYNNETNTFTVNGSICSGNRENQICNTDAIFEIPVAYPGSQEKVCIQNCDVPIVEEEQENTEIPVVIQDNNIEENLIPMIFSTKLKPNTIANIIAKNKNKTKIWKVKVNKRGIIKISIGKRYKGWKFSVKVRA